MAELTLDLFREKLQLEESYSYKTLCELLDQRYYSSGNSKSYQIKDWRRYATLEKIGTKYKIISINTEVAEKVDRRLEGNSFYKEDSRFKIPRKDMHRIGVYKIELENQIYIGSTTVGFRERFIQHISPSSLLICTRELLDKGATFDVLEYMDGQDEITIRKKEDEYIKQYRADNRWECINKRKEVLYKGKKKKKQPKKKKKQIIINEENYDKAIDLLKQYGLLG